MNRQELKRLQQVELDILKEFIKICEEEKLKYFAIGGTALGAVRHNGFIPWDDDIDIGMPRKDYEKFLKLASKKLPKHLFLQCLETEKNCPTGFAKIRNSNTTFVELSCKHLDINQGVYIDIFPLDGYPDKKIHRKIMRIKEKIIAIRSTKVFAFQKRSYKQKIISIMLILIFPNYQKMLIKANNYYKKFFYDKCEKVTNYFGVYGVREAMPKEIYGEGVYHQFEDIMIKLPDKVDEHLTRIYGDYMKLPPEEKRYGHHHTFAVDLEHSYKDVLKNNKQGDI